VSAYKPSFEGPIQGYATNTITKQLWRFQPGYDRDDLLQEAWLVFARCASRYPLLDTPQHFMALYKSALKRHLDALSTKVSRARPLLCPEPEDQETGETITREAIGETENAGYLRVLLRQAPREVLMVLNLFLVAPAELLELASAAWNKNGNPDDIDAFINRCLGLPKGSRPAQQVKEFLDP